MHGAATMAALPSADAVLLVSDASQEYTAPELEFLAPRGLGVPERGVRAHQDRPATRSGGASPSSTAATCAAAGIAAELFAVSSTLRWHAVLHGDAELNAESGFPELVGYLRQRVLGQADRLARRGGGARRPRRHRAARGNLRAERTAQQDPAAVAALTRELTEAQERATALKERSARWQQTLNDGVADLNADIDHDLRDRMREISRLAEEELVGGGDPTKVWDQFAGWVQQEVAAAASANFVWATQRARVLAQQVAEHFSDDREQLLPALRSRPVGRAPVGAGDDRSAAEAWGSARRR